MESKDTKEKPKEGEVSITPEEQSARMKILFSAAQKLALRNGATILESNPGIQDLQ